jgi:hypothetical protein
MSARSLFCHFERSGAASKNLSMLIGRHSLRRRETVRDVSSLLDMTETHAGIGLTSNEL